MVLQSHFRSANYITFIRRHKIILGKTEPHNVSRKENRSYCEVRNNKAILKILSLIQIFYLKQQSNIMWSFYSIKFEKSLFSNKFSVLYFVVRW